MSPRFKIFDGNNQYIGSMKLLTDALIVIVALGEGHQIRYGGHSKADTIFEHRHRTLQNFTSDPVTQGFITKAGTEYTVVYGDAHRQYDECLEAILAANVNDQTMVPR